MVKRKKSSGKIINKENIETVVGILSFLLTVDGVIRILFSTVMYYLMPEIYETYDLYFKMRWLGIGVLELLFAFGITKRAKWALYGLFLLSLVRIYTVIAFPPKGLFLPIYSNMFTYLFKLAAIVMVFYLFLRRKDFDSK